MEKSAKIMYIIGKVFTIISLVMMVFGIILGIIMMNNAQMIYDQLPAGTVESVEYIKFLGQYTLILSIVLIIVYIALIVLISKAKKALDEGSTKQGLHIAMIVIGALSFDIFYLLGGIFALVAIGSKNSIPQPASEEVIEVKEDNKEE